MADNLDVGTLSGRIDFEDKVTSTMDLVLQKIDALEGRFAGLGQQVAASAGGFVLAEVAMSAFKEAVTAGVDILKDLTLEGAGIADVEENFAHLTAGVGRLGDTMLGTLREGLHGTVTDFELMKTVNQDLTANMNLTDQQMKTLAEGAFALAQTTGGDVKTAFDTLNDAMLTGKTRALALLTGKIDLDAAEKKYAESLNTTADRLTATEKTEAARLAILESVGKATEKLGEQTDGLDEMYAQAETAFTNWYESLAKSVATSPQVIQAFTTIKDSLIGAFGGDTSTMLETVVGWINNVAEAVTEYGPIVINGFVSIKDWVLETYDAVVSSWDALPDWLQDVAVKSVATAAGLYAVDAVIGSASATITDMIGTAGNLTTTLSGLPVAIANISAALGSLKLIAGLTALEFTSLAGAKASIELLLGTISPLAVVIAGLAAAWMAWNAAGQESGWVRELSDSFEYASLRMQGFSESEADVMIATEHMNQQQKEFQETSKGSTKAADDMKKVMDDMAKAQADATETAKKNNEETERAGTANRQTAEEVKKFKEALTEMDSVGKSWKVTLETIDGETVEAVKYYLEAGVALDKLTVAYGLTQSQAKAIESAWKAGTEALKNQAAAVQLLNGYWTDYFEASADLGATDSQKIQNKALADYTVRVKALQDLGDANVEHYNQLWALYEKDTAMGDKARLLGDQHSKASLNERIAQAQDYMAFMNAHYDQYTATDRAAQAQVVSNLKETAANWGKVGTSIDADTEKVRTLSGEILTMKEYAAKQLAGGSTDVTSQNFSQMLTNVITSGGWNPSGQGSNIDQRQAQKMAEAGYSFQEILQYFKNLKNGANGPMPPPQGPKIPGFEEGGIGDFGAGTLAVLHGKEAIVPLKDGAGLGTQIVNFYVNGTAEESARKIQTIIMNDLKMNRKFGSA